GQPLLVVRVDLGEGRGRRLREDPRRDADAHAADTGHVDRVALRADGGQHRVGGRGDVLDRRRRGRLRAADRDELEARAGLEARAVAVVDTALAVDPDLLAERRVDHREPGAAGARGARPAVLAGLLDHVVAGDLWQEAALAHDGLARPPRAPAGGDRALL